MINKSPVVVELRPQLAWFAEEMEKVLQANDHKGGWEDMTPWEIHWRIAEEFEEVTQALGRGSPNYEIVKELCDVACLCMFMADNVHREAKDD